MRFSLSGEMLPMQGVLLHRAAFVLRAVRRVSEKTATSRPLCMLQEWIHGASFNGAIL